MKSEAYAGITILSLVGCVLGDGNDIGKPCDLTVDAGANQAVANTISLECESRLCLKPSLSPSVAPLNPPTSAGCSVACGNDLDCEDWAGTRDPSRPTDTRCRHGFGCAVPFEVGPLCCRNLCVCKDFLDPNAPDVPITCTQQDSLSTCRKTAQGSVPRVGEQTDFYLDVGPVSKSLCLEANLVDTNLSTAEVEPDCRAIYRVPTVDANAQITTYRDRDPPLPPCPVGATADNVSKDCWLLEHDTGSCPGTGQLVSIVRSAAAISADALVAGTQVALKCWTCPALISSAGCSY